MCVMKTIHSIEEIKIRAPAAQNVGPTFFFAAEARILISSIELIVFMKQINEQRSSRKKGGQCKYEISDTGASYISDF